MKTFSKLSLTFTCEKFNAPSCLPIIEESVNQSEVRKSVLEIEYGNIIHTQSEIDKTNGQYAAVKLK